MSNCVQALAYIVPVWARSLATAYLSLATFIGLPGNILVVAVQIKNKRKTPTDWFVLFMAISDLLSLIVCAPPFILATTGMWPLVGSSFWCKLHMSTLHMTTILSTFLIVCVCIDRYNYTVRNLPTPYFTKSNVLYICIGCFIAAILLTFGLTFVVGNNELGQCIFIPDFAFEHKIIHGVNLVIVVSCSLLVTVMYVKIIRVVTNSIKVSSGQPNRFSLMTTSNRVRILKTTKIMTIVTFVFILSTCVPAIFAVFLNSRILRNNMFVKTTTFFLTKGFFINNCTEPLFYILLYPSFREKALWLFKRSDTTGRQ